MWPNAIGTNTCVLSHTVDSRIISTLNKSSGKRLHIINMDNDLYFIFKHTGKLYSFFLINLLSCFNVFLFSILFFPENHWRQNYWHLI